MVNTVFQNPTPLRMRPGELSLAKELMRMDAVFGEVSRHSLRPEFSTFILPNIYESCSDSVDAFEYGALFQALIQKSESDVRRLLLSSTDLVFERGHDNQTPLHVAVCWPRGLRLLFELVGLACDSIIDVPDSYGHSAIEFAIFLNQAESVRILLDHSAAVGLEDASLFIHSWMIDRIELRDVFGVLSNELGCRRKQLLSIALEHLPDTSISKLGLRSVSVIQNNAAEVINHLKLQLVDIPQFYQGARPGTVYHSPVMPVNLAESLFQAGFTEVDFLVDGYSPLMIIQLLTSSISFVGGLLHYPLPLINFFEEKGADIHKPIPHSSYSLCYCYLNRPEWLAPVQWPKREHLPDLSDLLASSSEGVAGQCRNQYVYDTIRLCTFVKLGMRHTCCSYRKFEKIISSGNFHGPEQCGLRVMEPAEVAEIQEEDRHTAELLEMLMAEFEARLQSHPEPLDQFILGYWGRRMKQVEAERDQIGDDNIQAMRDIGIRFGSESESSWECESAASDEA
ncbi:Putative ankyrin repeat-containing domain superfamily [Colletotrichum destructivum]|uniref:Ankyrin repeat-containing domain superfamily n=1 Tax=Colletotrichum destructivum TaxID=34406 RepID=A0AAX4J2N2_9PEZI|nr:Putative ankyrin repeat-containing domain superfamily [Colletotrichum destructivum]